MLTPTKESLDIVKKISAVIKTSHHMHFHIIYDIAKLYDGHITYVEIGCYAGKSASLLMHRPNTKIISIDLGKPIDADIACENIKKFNKHNNEHYYIKGSSLSQKTKDKLESILGDNKIEILFIDGSHSYNDVISDFKMFNEFVKSGGYIVFDDYLDYKFSPDVKKAVDYLIDQDSFSSYNIIGTLENSEHAYPTEHTMNICFIIKKK